MNTPAPQPPIPPEIPHEVASHGRARVDEYHWMRDDTRSDPAVIAHLEAENAYADAVLRPLGGLRDLLYREMIARLRPDDDTVPVREGDWWHGVRYVAGGEYPVAYRRRGTPDGPEQLLFDGNARAAGHDFWSVGAAAVSPDDRLLAISEDTVGRRIHTVRVIDLTTGAELPDRIDGVGPSVAWADAGRSLYVVELHPETLLGIRVRRHVLGTDPSVDEIVFVNDDPAFYLDIRAGRGRRHVFVELEATDTTETRWCAVGAEHPAFAPVVPRREGHEYHVEELGDDVVLRTNLDAPNFRVVRAPLATAADAATWTEIVGHRDDAVVDDVLPLDRGLVVGERVGGLLRLRYLPWDGGTPIVVAGDDPASTVLIGDNREPSVTAVRYVVSSLVTPRSDVDLDLVTGARTLRKRAFAGDGFDPGRYRSAFIRVPARDGTPIPVSLLMAADTPRDGTAPLLQYGYGAYGISIDPTFRSHWLSLADRGVVVAIAHIRGGQELGRAWYESGRRAAKETTFTDFVDVTRGLARDGWCDPGRVVAMGGSAGGLLMGAVANMAPGDYRAIVAQVPFVDVVTTMLDESIPLTTNEYDEWGDPRRPEDYAWMLAYSPYDNVRPQPYPAMLVMSGLHDSQVQYWEPTKWVARLRRIGTGTGPILLHTRMDAGHGGASGRYRAYEDIALVGAFVLDALGATGAPGT